MKTQLLYLRTLVIYLLILVAILAFSVFSAHADENTSYDPLLGTVYIPMGNLYETFLEDSIEEDRSFVEEPTSTPEAMLVPAIKEDKPDKPTKEPNPTKTFTPAPDDIPVTTIPQTADPNRPTHTPTYAYGDPIIVQPTLTVDPYRATPTASPLPVD